MKESSGSLIICNIWGVASIFASTLTQILFMSAFALIWLVVALYELGLERKRL